MNTPLSSTTPSAHVILKEDTTNNLSSNSKSSLGDLSVTCISTENVSSTDSVAAVIQSLIFSSLAQQTNATSNTLPQCEFLSPETIDLEIEVVNLLNDLEPSEKNQTTSKNQEFCSSPKHWSPFTSSNRQNTSLLREIPTSSSSKEETNSLPASNPNVSKESSSSPQLTKPFFSSASQPQSRLPLASRPSFHSHAQTQQASIRMNKQNERYNQQFNQNELFFEKDKQIYTTKSYEAKQEKEKQQEHQQHHRNGQHSSDQEEQKQKKQHNQDNDLLVEETTDSVSINHFLHIDQLRLSQINQNKESEPTFKKKAQSPMALFATPQQQTFAPIPSPKIENVFVRFMKLMERILGQAEAEAQELYRRVKARTDDVDALTLLLSKVNSEKGAIDWRNNDEMKALVEQAKKIGVTIDSLQWTEEEKKLLKENIQMRKENLEKITQLERTDMQRHLQEVSQCHQARSNVLKLLKELMDTFIYNLRP